MPFGGGRIIGEFEGPRSEAGSGPWFNLAVGEDTRLGRD